jgi:hypothetical protein
MEGLKKASRWAKLAWLLIEGLQVKFFEILFLMLIVIELWRVFNNK